MVSEAKPKIAVVSMARDAGFFVSRWIAYYSAHLGAANLFLLLDGHDQPLPGDSEDINVIRLPHIEQGRSRGDRNRARLISLFARSLFYRYDFVIAHDIDEILITDPAISRSFHEYFSKPVRTASLSALGLDVGQHTGEEEALDHGRPILEQRSYAHVSARYTKAVVAARPLTWGSGFHRVKGRNFHIDPALYLFHFGMVDYNSCMKKSGGSSLPGPGWEGHLERRYEIFDLIRNAEAINGDDFFPEARRRQSLFRPVYALNKPGMLKEKPVIKIPERFRGVV
jgi:hypothetical protein